MNRQQLYRALPKVDLFLETQEGRALTAAYGRKETVEGIRRGLDKIRAKIMEGAFDEGEQKITEYFLTELHRELLERNTRNFKRVINATGIILHTNLGRAPVSAEAADGLAALLKGYSNLEYDLKAGKRGERYSHFEELICRLTGAEAAMAVNNNAAAVMLMLSTFAKGKEVILSRGEMIEIGGKFRIPEVMEASGCYLKEIGTTNKTHLSDYEDAVNERTGAILKVHTSNYRVLGFTASVAAKELVALKEKHDLPLIEDLGSGVLVPLEKYGLEHEPTVQECLASGVDVVCFSGDKLLGGPQAGIIAGKKKYIDKMKKNPLTRALRIDKCTAYLLESAFAAYLKDDYEQMVPVYRFLSRNTDQLQKMAEQMLSLFEKAQIGEFCQIFIDKAYAPMGGGSLPLEEIESRLVGVRITANSGISIAELAAALHRAEVPVIGRVTDDSLCFDMRCIEIEDLEIIVRETAECIRAVPKS